MSSRRVRGALVAALTTTAVVLGVVSAASADPAVQTPITNVASHEWNGTVGNARLGEDAMVNAGDVNGDGRADVLASTDAPRDSIYVLFSSAASGGAQNLENLPPSQGYSIVTADASPNAISAGDQNDDGVSDLLMTTANGEVAVVYGISDPTSLPQCVAPNATRCLNLASGELTPSQGYYITSEEANLSGGSSQDTANLGDVNADGVDDLAFGTGGITEPGAPGSVFVLYGGRTAGSDPVVLEDLPAAEGLRIDGGAPDSAFGTAVYKVGDLNQDGRADLAVLQVAGSQPAWTYMIYSPETPGGTMSVAEFGPTQGYRLAPPPGIGYSLPGPGGDVNGDGRPDLIASVIAALVPPAKAAVLFGPETAPAQPIPMFPSPPAGQGYVLAQGDDDNGFMSPAQAPPMLVGDLNGDDLPDYLYGEGTAGPGGSGQAGYAHVILGRFPAPPASETELGAEMTPDMGITLTGNLDDEVGTNVDPAGDLDEDGLPDFFVSASDTDRNAVANVGTVYVVLGRSLFAEANTGIAGGVGIDEAVLSGLARPHGQDSVAYFEYGTTEEYGQKTTDQEIGGNASHSLEAELSGLEPETTYHYRLVVENALGLKAYGADRTFTTDAAPVPPPPDGDGDGVPDGQDQCPSLPGPASNGGCPEDSTPPPGTAELALSVSPKAKQAKAGKAAKFTATLRNTGDGAAENARVCLKAPKKALEGSKCKQLGELAAGAQGKAKFKVKPTSKAKSGKSYTLKFKASAAGVKADKATAKVEIG